MKKFAQFQTQQEPAQPGVVLSTRALMTGPQQIGRLEKQFRLASDAIQDAMGNLEKTTQAYRDALENSSQAEMYMRRTTPIVNQLRLDIRAAMAQPTQELVTEIGTQVSELISGGAQKEQAASRVGREILSQIPPPTSSATNTGTSSVDAATLGGAAAAAGTAAGTAASTGVDAQKQAIQDAQTQQTSANTSQIQGFQRYLKSYENSLKYFWQEMMRQYIWHKQREKTMAAQYNSAKSAYAKQRAGLSEIQQAITTLNSQLAGWSERLSEFYAPAGGE